MSRMATSGCDAVTGAYGPSAGTVDRRRFRLGDASLTPTLIMRAGCSAAMFMTGSAVRVVGHWDVRFGLGARYGASEDADYALRFLALGFTGPEPELPTALGVSPDPRTTTISGHRTEVPGVFTAGDARMGSRLTVTAIDDGRRCAREVTRWLATRA